jgi:hypothetical protein
MPTALLGALTLPADLLRLAGDVLLAPSGLTAAVLAGALLVSMLGLWLACPSLGRCGAAIPLVSRTVALRAKSWRAAFLRQRDPDRAGRPRPRAPSAALTAAIP